MVGDVLERCGCLVGLPEGEVTSLEPVVVYLIGLIPLMRVKEVGHGFVNDLVSLRLAVELGCILKYSICTEYSYLVHKPVVVHSLTSLKVRKSGPFSPNPHWVYVEAIVVECLESPWILNGDIALSWSTQRKLQVHSHEEPWQSVYRDILSWERVQIERSQWEAFGGVFLE